MAARNLQELQKRYASLGKSAAGRGPGGPGGPGGPRRGGPGPRPKGKPKNSRATIRRLAGYIAAYRFRLAIVFACMLLSTLTALAGGYLLRDVYNSLDRDADPAKSILLHIFLPDAVEAGYLTDTQRLWCLGIILMVLAGIYAVGIVSTYLQGRLMMTVSQNAVEKLRNDLFRKLQKLPVRYFDSHPTGELMSRFTNDVDAIDMMINNTVTSLISGAITLVGTLIMMFYTSWILALVTVLFVPLIAFGVSFLGKKSGKYHAAQQAALGAVNGYIEETVTGSKVVKVFNHEEVCVEEFESLNNDMRDKQFKAQFYGGVMGPVMHNISNLTFAIVAGVGGLLCLFAGFDVGGLAIFCTYSRQFSFPINNISMQMSTIFSALAGAERVFAVMDEAPETADRPDAIRMNQVKGEVILEDVSFGYLPGQTILKNVSLYAHAGQKIAFVGSTGAGKTTVTNLLNRFYDIDEGVITIDGIDIRSYKRDDLRSNIAMVLQDTHLFSGTIMENIRYGRPDATDDEVIDAAKTASAHSFIMRLENGYQTRLEGDGANLSQGQRQLLNIARAAVSKAPILVLDEATSSVDTRTERHIEHGMDRLMKNRTTFVIAHRLSTVRNANAIMVLEKGEIIERGNHDQLLALGGRYHELYTGKKELD
jgi:ATP-binding cassette subfamily B protein